MKILFVTPRLPLPADTGAKIRTFNLLKNIAKDNAVTLLSFYFEENQEAVKRLKMLGIELYLVKAKENIRPRSIFSGKPISIEKYYSKEMQDKLKDIISSGNFNLVHFDHLHMGQYRESINGLPCVLDEHNVESIILERCASIEKDLAKRMIFKSQAKKMSRFEGNLAKTFDKCLAVSEVDKQNLAKLSTREDNIEVMPNGVDTEYFRPEGQSSLDSSQDKSDRVPSVASLVFTGSMDWLPNDDAVIYFCKDILPLIWTKNREVKFYIVGRNPLRELKKLAEQDERIVVTGLVEDVRPYISQAKVFVAPLRIGAGTRLKILEAMAMEKAVVSTTIGAEGISCSNEENIVLRDYPEGFAEAILRLLQNSASREALGKAARDLVYQHYDWSIIAAKLEKVYAEITGV